MQWPPILIVDKQDNPIGEASMEEAQQKGLYHRIVRVHVEDKDGRILLQKRAATVATFPNCWDNSAAGHVDAGETYEQAARRELLEELGIKAKLVVVGSYQTNDVWDDKKINRFNKVYRAIVDANTKLTPQTTEVSEVAWLTVDDIRQLIKDSPDKVTDGIVDVMKQFYGENKEVKRAVLFHGTSSDPTHHWQPWLKKELEQQGYQVYAPLLPDNDRPNRRTYEAFLRKSGWDFADNILVGHSSGATTVLNLLLADWFPKVKAVVLVGTFLNEKLTKNLGEFPDGLFDDLFLEGYDPERLKQKAGAFYFVHGSNDPYCDIQDAKVLCEQVGGTFMEIENGHHLGGTSGITELPELINYLSKGVY